MQREHCDLRYTIQQITILDERTIDKSFQDILLAAGLQQSDLGIASQDSICKLIMARETDESDLLLGNGNSTGRIMSLHKGSRSMRDGKR
jgi:hypothetical protein